MVYQSVVYVKYPWENPWTDYTPYMRINGIDIEERVNGAGICSIRCSNVDQFIQRSFYPGFQVRVFLREDDKLYGRPSFEGFVPPDYQPAMAGVENEIILPVVGYFDMFRWRKYTGEKPTGQNAAGFMRTICNGFTRPDGDLWVDFCAEDDGKIIGENITINTNYKNLFNSIRMSIVDYDVPLAPRFSHFIQTPRYDGTESTILSMRKEPLITGTPSITLDGDDILNPILVDETGDLTTSLIIGEEEVWEKRIRDENAIYHSMNAEKDIRSDEDNGLKSSQDKMYEIYSSIHPVKTISFPIQNHHQIPLLSLIKINNTDIVELQDNLIVYEKRVKSFGGGIMTTLICRSIKDEVIYAVK